MVLRVSMIGTVKGGKGKEKSKQRWLVGFQCNDRTADGCKDVGRGRVERIFRNRMNDLK